MKFKQITFSTFLSFSAISTSFAALDTDMQRCAELALEEINLKPKSIVVNNPSVDAREMDYDISSYRREYRMNIAEPKSGKNYGDIVCNIDNSGEISSVWFLSKSL